MAYYNYFLDDLNDLKDNHPGYGQPVSATIFGNAYPTDEAFTVYVWDYSSYATPDDDEVVKPTYEPSDNGRWLKVELDSSVAPQVNANWTANSGLAQILNKPSLHNVATSGSYNDLTNKPSLFDGNYNSLSNKPTIPTNVSVGGPNSRTVALATAYQATDNTKPAIVTITLTSTASLSLTGGTTVVGELRIGPANTVATGASGTAVGQYKNSLTGTLTIGLNIQTDSNGVSTFILPAGWYFAVRQTTGSGLTVVSAFDQTVGIQ